MNPENIMPLSCLGAAVTITQRYAKPLQNTQYHLVPLGPWSWMHASGKQKLSFSSPTKIGLGVYLWVTKSLCTLCTDVEQPPRSAKWEKARCKSAIPFLHRRCGGRVHTHTCLYMAVWKALLLRLHTLSSTVSTPLPLFKNWSTFGINTFTFKTRSPRPWSALDDWGNLTPQQAV